VTLTLRRGDRALTAEWNGAGSRTCNRIVTEFVSA
jgi:hypothetical protein